MDERFFSRPIYLSDELKLQNILPEEIWLLIFNTISESVHYHRICVSSPYFHKLLLPLRTRILFPEVNKLFVKQKVLNKRALISCRAVCKVWKHEVDVTFHQTLSQAMPDDTDWTYFESSTCILSPNLTSLFHRFVNESKMNKFLANFHNSHFLTGSNPFPFRSISIALRPQTFPHIYYNKLWDILQIYGHHIWHCCVIFWTEDVEQELRIFRSLLSQLSEIQTLRIHYFFRSTNEQAELVQKFLRENPLPKLKKLKILEENTIAGSLFSQLIQNNPHITKLKMFQLDLCKHSTLLFTPLPYLEELHIVNLNSRENFLQLQNVQVQWPLKKLTVFCTGDIPHVNIVFHLIETQWGETLTDLNIFIPSWVSVRDTNPLKLRRLQNLNIKMRKYACMDFILPMANSLVKLGVCHDGIDQFDKRMEKNSTIKFFLHRKNLLKFNIWKYLPKLKEVNYCKGNRADVFRARMFRRYDCERNNMQKNADSFY